MSHEKLRQVIIAANPSLLDLSFGCRCKNIEFGYESTIIGDEDVNCDDESSRLVTYITKGVINGDPQGVEDKTDIADPLKTVILGHPIQLHHIINTIRETFLGGDLPGSPIKHINKCNYGIIVLSNVWDFSKPFSEQSAECLSFLTELLCEK